MSNKSSITIISPRIAPAAKEKTYFSGIVIFEATSTKKSIPFLCWSRQHLVAWDNKKDIIIRAEVSVTPSRLQDILCAICLDAHGRMPDIFEWLDAEVVRKAVHGILCADNKG